LAEVFPAVESEEIRVMEVVRTAFFIIPRGATDSYEVVSLELPVDVLKTMLFRVEMAQ
jgi:hypothetical protein